MTFLPRLHWLRGVLALSVVASHLTHLISDSKDNPLLRCGTGAVPVFFVLSGFVMFQVLQRSSSGVAPALAFLLKRALRIFPAYWFFLGLIAVFIWSGGRTWDDAQSPFVDWAGGWALLSRQPALWFPMAVAWSLVFEMIFYYVLTFVVLNRRFGLVVLFSYFAWAIVLQHWSPIQIYGLYPLCGLFLTGLALGLLNEKKPHYFPKLVPLLFVSLGLFLAFVLLGFSFHGLVERTAAVLLVAGVLGLERTGAPRLHVSWQKALQFLGTISFSLYVGYTLTQSTLFVLLGRPTLFTAPFYVGAPILIAYGSFTLIEKPCIDLARWIDTRFILHRPVEEVLATKELEVPPSAVGRAG